MNGSLHQQIVISGLGGQGVLFVTRLLAEAAMDKGLPVFTAETHGMAQRGGTVLSHLKVGAFYSPLIRPGQADGLLSLKAETLAQHGAYLKPGGWTVVNHGAVPVATAKGCSGIDAESLARGLGQLRAVNLIVLGYALGLFAGDGHAGLFCGKEDIDAVIHRHLARRPELLRDALAAVACGFDAATGDLKQ
ncbi:MAG: 2-oxoacid:acceptor oxidoreductase family protein [Pseudomonadota bacterium]